MPQWAGALHSADGSKSAISISLLITRYSLREPSAARGLVTQNLCTSCPAVLDQGGM